MTDAYQLWQPFNPVYGPWYRALFKVGQQTVVAVVQPDMEPDRWFWSVRFPASEHKHLPEVKIGGHTPDLDSAKRKAEEVARIGRPTLG